MEVWWWGEDRMWIGHLLFTQWHKDHGRSVRGWLSMFSGRKQHWQHQYVSLGFIGLRRPQDPVYECHSAGKFQPACGETMLSLARTNGNNLWPKPKFPLFFVAFLAIGWFGECFMISFWHMEICLCLFVGQKHEQQYSYLISLHKSGFHRCLTCHY